MSAPSGLAALVLPPFQVLNLASASGGYPFAPSEASGEPLARQIQQNNPPQIPQDVSTSPSEGSSKSESSSELSSQQSSPSIAPPKPTTKHYKLSEEGKKKRFKQVRKEDSRLAPISLTPEGLDRPAFLEAKLLPKIYRSEELAVITLRKVLTKLHSLALEGSVVELTRDKMREFQAWNHVGVHLSSIWSLLLYLEQLQLVAKEESEHAWRFLPGFYKMMDRINKGLLPYIEEGRDESPASTVVSVVPAMQPPEAVPHTTGLYSVPNSRPESPVQESLRSRRMYQQGSPMKQQLPVKRPAQKNSKRVWPPQPAGLCWYEIDGQAYSALSICEKWGPEALGQIVYEAEVKARSELSASNPEESDASVKGINRTSMSPYGSESAVDDDSFCPGKEDVYSGEGSEDLDQSEGLPRKRRHVAQQSSTTSTPQPMLSYSPQVLVPQRMYPSSSPSSYPYPPRPTSSHSSLLASLPVSGVCEWLESVGMGGYVQLFKANNMDGRSLALCGLPELQQGLGLMLGDAIKIIKAFHTDSSPVSTSGCGYSAPYQF